MKIIVPLLALVIQALTGFAHVPENGLFNAQNSISTSSHWSFYRTQVAVEDDDFPRAESNGPAIPGSTFIGVRDTTPPVITCPNDKVVECRGNYGPDSTGIAMATDNSGSVTITHSDNISPGSCSNLSIIRTWTATDSSGNSASCTQWIYVIDRTGPVITCPANTTRNCTDNTSPDSTGVPTVTDACNRYTRPIHGDFRIAGNCPGNYTIRRLWQTEDACGNLSTCVQFITVEDRTAPTLACPPAINIACDESIAPDHTGMATATDDCSGAAVSYHDAITPGNCPGNYTITRTWTATDACGNSSAGCTQTIHVEDRTPPNAVCQDVTVTLVNDQASITAAQVGGASTDNCSGIKSMTLSKTSFTCTNFGSNTVTLTVKDQCDNESTCTAVVTVTGTLPSCTITVVPANNTYTGGNPNNIYLGYGPQSATLQVNLSGGSSNNTYSWTGPVSSLNNTHTANPVFTPTLPGTYTFSVTVTNEYGCTSTCSTTLCVKDIRVPGNDGKVYVCHSAPGNPSNAHALAVSVNAIPAHLSNHAGDYLGMCDQTCGVHTARLVRKNAGFIMDEELGMAIYPNPTTDGYHIRIESNAFDFADVLIYDLTGRLLEKAGNLAIGQETIIGRNLASGAYIVEVRQGSISKKVKVMKL